ncbi:MAG: HD domain-containing phosphohydrolase, partial [Kiritimatiellia bacterium]
VDDDTSILKITKILLESDKMAVQTFETGSEALQVFATNPVGYDIALIDLNLEDMTGLELTRRLNEKNPFLVSIIITGDATLDNAISSMRHGAYDFIQKPVQRNQLRLTLERALEYHRLRLENEEYQQNLETMVRRKSIELTNALKRTRDSFDFTLRAMTAMLDAREHSTAQHSVRVQELTVMMAGKFGFHERDIDGIRQGALLHDIGKIAIADNILLKVGPLTDTEQATMRTHVTVGHDLIQSNPEFKAAADIILCHHEDFDGSGYPRGLKGQEIPLGARIFSVVDAYDAMRSTRPYRQGMPRADATDELKKHSGTQFDPTVVQMFLEHLDEIETLGQWP